MSAKRRRPATEPQLPEGVTDPDTSLANVVEALREHMARSDYTVVSKSAAGLGRKAIPPRIGAIKIAADAAQVYEVTPKLANAIRVLGNNTVADLLGVSRSQPGRWARGEEGISPENQAAILDLDFVLSVLLRTMPSSLAGIWLVSPNGFLNGARPVDAFRIEGHGRVVEAIQAYAEGAFA